MPSSELENLSLTKLLAPMSGEEFLQKFWGRSPVHIPGEASKFSSIFGLQQLTEALQTAERQSGEHASIIR